MTNTINPLITEWNKKHWRDRFLGKSAGSNNTIKDWATDIVQRNVNTTTRSVSYGWPFIADMYLVAEEVLKESNDKPQQD